MNPETLILKIDFVIKMVSWIHEKAASHGFGFSMPPNSNK